MKNIKILIIRMWAEELNIYSYNCQEIGLAKALVRKGNICDIVLYTEGDTREEDYLFDNKYKIHIYYLKAKKVLKNCFFEKKLNTIIKNYDVVQSTEYDQIDNLRLFEILGKKLVIYHGPYKSKYTKRYLIKCLISDIIISFRPKYKEVTFISKSNLAKKFLNDKGYKNVYNIGVGLDIERFNKVTKNKNIENLSKSKKGNKYILYVGKIEKRRNILFLLSVFNSIQRENTNVKLILVGTGKKKYVKACNNYIINNKLQNRIYQYNAFSQEELSELYRCCDIFVLPTRYDIFGMVLLEALYFGLKIITTLNGGSSTILKNNQNGIICEDNNFKQWFDAISNLLKCNKMNKKINDDFIWDNLVENFLNIYKKGYEIYE